MPNKTLTTVLKLDVVNPILLRKKRPTTLEAEAQKLEKRKGTILKNLVEATKTINNPTLADHLAKACSQHKVVRK